MTKKISKIPPSKMNRIVNCPWSYTYDKRSYYDPDIDYDKKTILGWDDTSKGIVAHRFAAGLLKNNDKEVKDALSTGLLSKTMQDNILGYAEFVYDIVPSFEEEPELKVEHYLNLDFLYDGCYGKADAIIDAKDTLTIIDLKYGNLEIEAEDNYQLVAYAIGAEAESKRSHNNINLYIYNAFSGNSKHWFLDKKRASELADLMKFRIEKAFEKDEKYISAGPWCESCSHHRNCPHWFSRVVSDLAGDKEMTNEDWDKVANWFIDEGKSKNIDEMNKIVKDKIEEGVIDTKIIDETETYKWTKQASIHIAEYLKSKGYPEETYKPKTLLSPSQLRKNFSNTPEIVEIERIIKTEARKERRRKIKKK